MRIPTTARGELSSYKRSLESLSARITQWTVQYDGQEAIRATLLTKIQQWLSDVHPMMDPKYAITMDESCALSARYFTIQRIAEEYLHCQTRDLFTNFLARNAL